MTSPGPTGFIGRAPGLPGGPQLPPNAPAVPFWEREGLVTRLLGITGAVITLAGLVMLLVLAVQQNWLGPVARVIGGWVLAVGLVAGAHVVRSREKRSGRSGGGAIATAATGFAAAFLCVVAMAAIYRWIPPVAGLALAGLVVVTGLVIARRWDSHLLAAMIVAGAALHAPLVTDEPSWILSAFLVVLAIAAWPAQIGKSWSWVTVARLLPASLIVMPTSVMVQNQADEPLAHLLVTFVFAVAGLAMAAIDERRDAQPILASMTVLLSAAPLVLSAALQPLPMRSIAFGLAALIWLAAAGLGEATKRLASRVTAPSMGAGTLALVGLIVSSEIVRWQGTLLLVAAAAFLGVAGSTRSRVATWAGLAVTAFALLGYLRHPFTILSERSALLADMPVVIGDSLVAAVVALALSWLTIRSGLSVSSRRLARAVAWFIGLSVATTAAVATGVLIGQALEEPSSGFRAGHAVATILWMVTSVWLLGLGLRRTKDAKWSIAVGLALAAVSVAKLFAYDLAVLSGIWRVLAFIVVGLMLLAAGTGYARALERARILAETPMIPGHQPLPPAMAEASVHRGSPGAAVPSGPTGFPGPAVPFGPPAPSVQLGSAGATPYGPTGGPTAGPPQSRRQ